MSLKKILLDTDIGPDCDDAAAIAMLNIYSNRGLCEILGIAHCTSNPYGAGTIDAICRYYGNKDIVISTYLGKDFLDDEKSMIYNKTITEEFDNRYKKTQPDDAVEMYRKILSTQQDKSIEIIAIGPLNNLSALLNSAADKYSLMSGRELIESKVIRLVSMAGIFETPVKETEEEFKKTIKTELSDFVEFNVVCDIEAARNVAENWPTPKIYLGFEARLLETGVTLKEYETDENPVKLAYKLYTENGLRFSWDLMTVEYAIDDKCGHYALSEAGQVRFDERGKTIWEQRKDGKDKYVIWAENKDKIAGDIDKLLIMK